jgi:hypothetical protein
MTWRRVKRWLRGRKQKWTARLYVICGLLVELKFQLDGAGVDASHFLPEKYGPGTRMWPWVLIGTGLLFEGLRWLRDRELQEPQASTDKAG